jgi:hypothetical protein
VISAGLWLQIENNAQGNMRRLATNMKNTCCDCGKWQVDKALQIEVPRNKAVVDQGLE